MTSIDAIEQQLLHGVRRDGDSSPPRKDSPHSSDDESGGEDENEEGLDGEQGQAHPPADHPSLGPRRGANTGPKGVRVDAQRQADTQRAIRADQVRETNAQMERMALGKSQTWKEDEEIRRQEAEAGVKPGQLVSTERENDDEELAEIRQRRLNTLKGQAASNEARRQRMAGDGRAGTGGLGAAGPFGHLREVGPDHYAHAIDVEDKAVCVVVHIYVKHVHACARVTSALSSLARLHTNVKFIQVRAGSIGFGSGGKEVADEAEGDEEAEEVVPTVLMYRAGQLLANLVRIDLEEQFGEGLEKNVRDVLRHHGAPL